MAEPGDSRTAAPLLDLAERDRGRVGRIRAARDQEIEVITFAAEDLVRGDERAETLPVETFLRIAKAWREARL